jgi:hypothetical protein
MCPGPWTDQTTQTEDWSSREKSCGAGTTLPGKWALVATLHCAIIKLEDQ